MLSESILILVLLNPIFSFRVVEVCASVSVTIVCIRLVWLVLGAVLGFCEQVCRFDGPLCMMQLTPSSAPASSLLPYPRVCPLCAPCTSIIIHPPGVHAEAAGPHPKPLPTPRHPSQTCEHKQPGLNTHSLVRACARYM